MTTTGAASPAKRSSKIDCPPIFVPLGILVICTGLIRVLDLDLQTAAHFHESGVGWPWGENAFVLFLYRFGTIPAIGVGCVAAVIWVVSAFKPAIAHHRPLAMFMALVLIIGPGLVVNSLFKENFGRPRPEQVEQFGGDTMFLPVWQPDFEQDAKSFPSGHASMGFYWLCLGVFYWERKRKWAWGFLVLGLFHGALMGFGRIAQGGHWLSDVLWAAGFVYLVSWILYRTLGVAPAYSPPQQVSDVEQP